MKMLRTARKQAGLTMKELGAKIGVSESAISQYENGRREADFETLLKIGEVLSCSIDYLLRGEEKLTAKDGELDIIALPSSEPQNQSIVEKELLRKFRYLDDRGKSAVLNTLEHEYNSLLGEQTSPPAKNA